VRLDHVACFIVNANHLHHASGCDALRCRLILTSLVESKPNNTMIKTNTSGVMLMASSNHRQKIAKATMARRTPINGLEMAKQNEKFQPEFGAIGLVFMVFSKELEGRHFTKT